VTTARRSKPSIISARRITDEELAKLEARHEACRKLAEDERLDDYYAENSAFHTCIYRATHNTFIAHEAMRLHAMLQPYRRLQLQLLNREKRSLKEHEAVVSAIQQGDDQAADQAMRHHVLIQGDRFHDLLAALRSDA